MPSFESILAVWLVAILIAYCFLPESLPVLLPMIIMLLACVMSAAIGRADDVVTLR